MFASIAGRRCVRALQVAALLGAAFTAAAQTPRPDPSDARAQVPPVPYVSAFSSRLGVGGSKPMSWREANDTVARIGGWRVYSREAQAPEAAAPASAPDGGHRGHRTP